MDDGLNNDFYENSKSFKVSKVKSKSIIFFKKSS